MRRYEERNAQCSRRQRSPRRPPLLSGTSSPLFSLTRGTLDKLCLGTGDTSAGVLRAVNSDQQNQQCSDTSTWATRDASLSHLLDNLSTLSANTGS
ncbi:hypothetical protein TNCT6_40140 [Streptomyces sp. 6-11-2]|nr:hypothetical protein TNCT6_40140 [Streptomyces sp. 6-11-2]